MPDFEAKQAAKLKEALGLAKAPGSLWMRQRFDARTADLHELPDTPSQHLIDRLGLTDDPSPTHTRPSGAPTITTHATWQCPTPVYAQTMEACATILSF